MSVTPPRSSAPRHQARLALTLLLCLLVGPLAAAPTASSLFETLRPLVYQVRVIDVASGDKTTIGSGFRVGADGLFATNYHVVSLLIQEPDKYRMELVGEDGAGTPATVVGIDVLHDLALVRDPAQVGDAFSLLAGELAQGERIFSMGNPRDLGMTIIEGNYNGLVKSSRFERLLFSGSLNAGMSGGPAFNSAGTVIGINVATGGEQLSFLVPVKHLQALIAQSATAPVPADFQAGIAQALLTESDAFYAARMADSWRMERFGDLMLPRDLSPAMKCWGHNVDDDDVAYEGFHQHCRSEEYLFLEDDLYTGDFSYSYEWMTTEKLNRLQFYTAVERRFEPSGHGNAEDEKAVGRHHCVTDFIDIDGSAWKAALCLRRYKDYAGLHDASLVLVSLAANDRAAVIRMAATGIGRQPALGLFGKLMHAITWAR